MLKQKIDFSKVNKKIVVMRIKKLQLLGNDLIAGITLRTLSGKDVKLKGFKPYSPNYKKTGKVDLKVTGNMLGSMQSKKIKTSQGEGLRFSFGSSAEKIKAKGNQQSPRDRRFFGIDRNQKKFIKKQLQKI